EIYTSAYEGSSDRQIKFTVYDLGRPEPTPVGTAMLLLDLGLDVAEYTISIGEEAARGRGVGTEATLLVLDYAFHVTGLECVYLTVLEPNTGAITAYERAGFRRQGLRRNSNKWLGHRVNEVHMDAVAAEFPGPSQVKIPRTAPSRVPGVTAKHSAPSPRPHLGPLSPAFGGPDVRERYSLRCRSDHGPGQRLAAEPQRFVYLRSESHQQA